MRLVKVSKHVLIGWVSAPLSLVRLLPAVRDLEAKPFCLPLLRVTRLEVGAGLVTLDGDLNG